MKKIKQNQAGKQITAGSDGQVGDISAADIKSRKDWLGIDESIDNNLEPLDELVSTHIDELMDYMYDHFMANEHARTYFPTPEILERAKSAQKNYFLRLTKGNYDQEYVANRLRVGEVHYKTGLDTTWYLGAYCNVLSWYVRKVCSKLHDDPEKALATMSSLLKLIFFDMGLAIDTYNAFKEDEIRRQQDAITKLESESQVTKGILESAPVGIIRLNAQFKMEEFNEEFLAIVEEPEPEHLKDSTIFDICPDLEREPFEDAFKEGKPHKENAARIVIGAGQKVRFFDWAVWPTKSPDGETTGLVAMFTNVTDTVMLQQQREDFVATLTHDLKTPLIAANRALKLILDGQFGDIEESQRELMDTILESNDDMYQMVVTLLDVYKYDSGTKKLHLEPQSISDILSKLENEFLTLAQSRKIELCFNSDSIQDLVMCDKNEVKRVLQNLLENSIKYTPNGGKISIDLAQGAHFTEIKISDTGKGISDEDMPKLFQRFWQASNSGRYYASTGLGLYLCRKIVESHGGKIWCTSKIGEGSQFYFTLPNLSD